MLLDNHLIIHLYILTSNHSIIKPIKSFLTNLRGKNLMKRTTNNLDSQSLNEEVSHSEQITSSQSNSNHYNKEDNNEDKKKLFSDEKFQKLMQVKQEIFLATDVSTSLRKIIDKLITDQQLEEVKNKLIEQFK